MKVTRMFRFLKETKNTVRYEEQLLEGEGLVVGNLYIQKAALPDGDPPKEVTITVEIA